MLSLEMYLLMLRYLYGIPDMLCKKVVFINFQNSQENTCAGVSRPTPLLKNTPAQVFLFRNFAIFLQHLFCITCKRLLLVLVRIGLVWRAPYLSMFPIIDCKSVFKVLRCSFQLILHCK